MARKRFLIVTASPERAAAVAAVAARAEADAERRALESEVLAELGRRAHAAVLIDADSLEAPALPLCRRLRALLPPNTCALILFGSPRGSAKVVEGLDAGADDFWPYPLNEPVCLAYLGAILRRVSPLGTAAETLKDGDLSIDPVRRLVRVRGKPLDMRAKEFDLLYLLLKQRGKVLTREHLMEGAWGRGYFGNTRTIDFHVSRLRRKLGKRGARIKTVAKTGYLFTGK